MRFVWLSLVGVGLWAQPSYFQFDVDQDRLGGAVDFSFLNQPLGQADRLFVREGHFFRVGADLVSHTEDDTRVRLFGVNLAFTGNFPNTEADSVRIAKRLRRLGVNVVRLHHMDTQPDAVAANGASILTTGPYPTINMFAAERLRTFLDALRAEGIYANLNLKVGYQFQPAVDDVPAVEGGTPDQSKPLHIFWPRLVEKQAEFAAKVVEALRLEDDPVLGLVEINNESSLVYAYQVGQIDRFVTGEYRAELGRRWNVFLRGRYETTDALRQAWWLDESDGPELLDGLAWRTELHGAARLSYTELPERALRVQVTNGSAVAMVKKVGFSLNTARPYVATVEMRADLPNGVARGVYFDVKEDVSPWRSVRAQTVQVTNQWQRYTMTFTPSIALDGTGRFATQVEQLAGTTVEIRNWSLSQPGRRGLLPEESLEASNVSTVTAGVSVSDAKAEDWIRYLAELDRRYLETVRDAVRAKVGPLTPVAGTQMDFGGLMNLDSHAGLDYQDRHYYVDHYAFPGTAWDGRNWTIGETSNLATGLSPFLNAAWSREAGRPYTVSEFNQPWPNTYGAETDPALAAFAAFQDWDGLMHFAYAHNRTWDIGVPNGFNLNGDWGKLVNFGQSAWLFRTGAVAAGGAPVVAPYSEAARLAATRRGVNGSLAGYASTAHGIDPAMAFTRRVAIARAEEPWAEKPVVAEPGEIRYAARLFTVDAAKVAAVMGFARRAEAGPLTVEIETARGFAVVMLTALDERPLAESARMLLTSPGFTLRSQPGATPAREQRLVNYPGSATRWTIEPDQARPSGDLNGGSRPVWMERIPMKVELRAAAARLTIYPLSASGARMEPIEAERTAEGFRARLDAASPWFELVLER